MFEPTIALNTLLAFVLLLAATFFYLLGYTLWTRKKKQYWKRYEKKFRDHYSPIIFDFVEKNNNALSADAIIKNITHRTKDYVFFLNLLDQLREILKGDERERLRELIEHPKFVKFYANKLFELSSKGKLYACDYFQNIPDVSNRIIARLIDLSRKKDLKLAYAATKALQQNRSVTIRKRALHRFLKRNDISELMVSELLHNFDTGLTEERPEILKALKRILMIDISPSKKSIITRYLGYKNFFECSTFLHESLIKIQNSTRNKPFIRGLIFALGELLNTDSAEIIRDYFSNKQTDEKTRIECIISLNKIGGKENLVFLVKELLNVAFPVRKVIIKELVSGDNYRRELLQSFITSHQLLINQFLRGGSIPQGFSVFIEKIQSITRGIEIYLNQDIADAST